MSSDQTIDFVIAFVLVGLVAAGLVSLLIGKVLDWRDALMSRASSSVPAAAGSAGTPQFHAEERPREPSGTVTWNDVLSIAEHLSTLDDDALLAVLALVEDSGGDPRFAESRVAKFIPGKVEDRLNQVRKIRGTTPPPPPGRSLKVRDAAGERVIPY